MGPVYVKPKLVNGKADGRRFNVARRGGSGFGGSRRFCRRLVAGRRRGFLFGGEQIVIGGQIEVGQKLGVSLDGVGVRQINLGGELHFVFRARRGRKNQLKLAQINHLFVQRTIELKFDRERRVRKLSLR